MVQLQWYNSPGEKFPRAVQVKKVLLNAFTLRGRCSRVVLVCEVDETNKCNESKSNSTIPGPVGEYSLRYSKRLQSQGFVGKSGVPRIWNVLTISYQIRSRNLSLRCQTVPKCAFRITVLRWCSFCHSSFKIAPYGWARIDRCASRHFFLFCVFTLFFNQPWNRGLKGTLRMSWLVCFFPIICVGSNLFTCRFIDGEQQR